VPGLDEVKEELLEEKIVDLSRAPGRARIVHRYPRRGERAAQIGRIPWRKLGGLAAVIGTGFLIILLGWAIYFQLQALD